VVEVVGKTSLWTLGAVSLAGLAASGGCAPIQRAAPIPGQATAGPILGAAPTAAPIDLNTEQTEFGGLLRLEVARLVSPEASPGGSVVLELTWRLLRQTHRDFQVVVRLVDRDGRTRVRRDTTIGGPGSGTSGWSSGRIGSDYLDLRLPQEIEPGRYDLTLAVIDPANGVQIPISAEASLPPVVVDYEQVVGSLLVGQPGQ
jgi:hypothetical protein